MVLTVGGWTNYFANEGIYTMDIYAGAAHCDTDKGELVGQVTVSYLNDEVYITYNLENGFVMSEAHVYVGCTPYPLKGKKETVAPGQYPYKSEFSDVSIYTIGPIDVSKIEGGIYVIAHAVVCEAYGEYDDTLSDSLSPKRNTVSCRNIKAKTTSNNVLRLDNGVKFEAYPVPFNGEINLKYSTPFDTDVTIEIFDVKGNLIRSFNEKSFKDTISKLKVDLSRTDNQLFFVRLTTNQGTVTKKIVSSSLKRY